MNDLDVDMFTCLFSHTIVLLFLIDQFSMDGTPAWFRVAASTATSICDPAMDQILCVCVCVLPCHPFLKAQKSVLAERKNLMSRWTRGIQKVSIPALRDLGVSSYGR